MCALVTGVQTCALPIYFFLPLTAALVIAIALVPLLEWLERRGLPSALAAFFALVTFLAIINAALAIIVVPATGWFARIPESIPRIQSNLDRKSGVEGKSVSVRVDLGGRRTLQKKKQKKITSS